MFRTHTQHTHTEIDPYSPGGPALKGQEKEKRTADWKCNQTRRGAKDGRENRLVKQNCRYVRKGSLPDILA